MRPVAQAWSILIEVTNACRLRCAHCTAGVPHVRRPSLMSLEQIERALQSLEGWRKGVGCFGGEPTLHPDFPDVCALFARHFPRRQLAIWTCGGPKYESYRALIDETFSIVAYNDHQGPGFHQPLLIASEEVVPDLLERQRLIEHCWLPRHWSPVISGRGAFFCEVAATLDGLFDGPGGVALQKGWWRQDFAAFQYQRDQHCCSCSIPLPIEPLPDTLSADWVSPRNAMRLREAGSPMALGGRLHIVDAVDLTSAPQRNPRWFAAPGSPHYWTRLSLRAGLWLAAQYRHAAGAPGTFTRDALRYVSLKASYSVRARMTHLRRWL